ncbi:Tryptophan synthase alpha chain [Phycisphaerae bacterium RAS1]|nr:Tryptophan synthase alpha chain [Phycisphaerae bacterium RAS1]
MNALARQFSTLRAAGRRGLLPYITAGYPDVDTTIEILRRLDPQRCACVELGIPFSDPIADGPVIQTSFSRALQAGFRLDALLGALSAARGEIAVPLVAMVSYSIIYRRGVREFVAAARDAGVSGVLAPDVAIEEAESLAAVCRDADMGLILIAAPTSTDERLRRIAAISDPFIYYQSVAGVTGERQALPPQLAQRVSRLRALSGKPVCVGFGVSGPEQVRAVCAFADGAIVGSAIVRKMNEAVTAGQRADALAETIVAFVHELASAV